MRRNERNLLHNFSFECPNCTFWLSWANMKDSIVVRRVGERQLNFILHFCFNISYFLFCWFHFLLLVEENWIFILRKICLPSILMSTCWFPFKEIEFVKKFNLDEKLTWFVLNLCNKIFHKLPDCEKPSTTDQLYESNTNNPSTTSSSDLSDFISSSNTSTSGNTRTTNTNTSSNNSNNNSNQLNGQDSSFPAGGEYKHFTSEPLFL